MLNFLIGPAERYDLIVDFSGMPMGSKFTLTNYHALVHYPGVPGLGPEISEVTQFQVTKPLSYPETVTRIITDPWSPPAEPIAGIPNSGTELPATYVHHCHLLEREDDDLMRPFTIVDPDAPVPVDQGGGHGGGGHGGHGR
ncbi:hypothetical protein OG304_23465 [Streptomyces sp. NBC_00160]|uniref:hypothetical protein n=1 Tax=Streptomyces sp. NBC_00160 TaxID=2903628 RepID=UPI00224CD065|nr:hypothetical protein [Streptomyces sp. NBC_00160]MCX5306378.1 hypothetical protein [Streptomyces sp. NBC_00160]